MAVIQSPTEIRDLLYQCRFRQVIQETAFIDPHENIISKSNLFQYRARAFFEMGQVQSAISTLRTFCSSVPPESEEHRYSRSLISFFNKDYKGAKALLRSLAEESDSAKAYFRYLFTLSCLPCLDAAESARLRRELYELKDLVSLDYRLFWYLERASDLRREGHHTLAENTAYQIIREAKDRQWTYFIILSHYTLGRLGQDRGHLKDVHIHLQLMNCYLTINTTNRLSQIVLDRFDSFQLDRRIQLDDKFMRVLVGGDWLQLSNKPKVYRFLQLLASEARTFTKREISEALWPGRSYCPQIHDKRIFDTARRLRGCIEGASSEPLLMSGRAGYKLMLSM